MLCILSDEAVFLHSKDVIAGKHNGNDVIKDVESDHVMQVTMNNISTSKNMSALEKIQHHLYWLGSTSHQIDVS